MYVFLAFYGFLWLFAFCLLKVRPDTVVHVWKNRRAGFQDELAKVTGKGYKVLLSACYYLSHEVDPYAKDAPWQMYYQCDPHNFTG